MIQMVDFKSLKALKYKCRFAGEEYQTCQAEHIQAVGLGCKQVVNEQIENLHNVPSSCLPLVSHAPKGIKPIQLQVGTEVELSRMASIDLTKA